MFHKGSAYIFTALASALLSKPHFGPHREIGSQIATVSGFGPALGAFVRFSSANSLVAERAIQSCAGRRASKVCTAC